jgi:hypothetical protein
MQFIIEPLKEKRKKKEGIKLECPDYVCPLVCGQLCTAHVCSDYCECLQGICMDGLNCPDWCSQYFYE